MELCVATIRTHMYVGHHRMHVLFLDSDLSCGKKIYLAMDQSITAFVALFALLAMLALCSL